jgi:hypothetical protein
MSVVYGCIQSPSDYSNSALMSRLNRETLAALPEQGETFSPVDDAFPVPGGWSAHQFSVRTTPLSPVRSMFGIPPEDRDYRTQVIPFGVSLNTIERRWEAWLERFEDLLRRLY